MNGLRNKRETLSGGRAVMGTRYVGYLGSDILTQTSTGPEGRPGVLANDDLDPSKRYRVLITHEATAGSFWLYENGAGWATADAAVTYVVYEDNLLVT